MLPLTGFKAVNSENQRVSGYVCSWPVMICPTRYVYGGRNKRPRVVVTTLEKEFNMDMSKLTVEDLMKLVSCLNCNSISNAQTDKHPMLGRRCLLRTYSAGVHIGLVSWVNPQNSMEVRLTDALRLWKWEGGGLSLSAVAVNGINGGRLNRTNEIVLTNVIEFIPTTSAAETSFLRFIE